MPALVPPLLAILAAELAAGNRIQEISAWPPTCELLVTLRHKFGRAYSVRPPVAYRLLNDRHYWYAEYTFAAGRQLLACGFE